MLLVELDCAVPEKVRCCYHDKQHDAQHHRTDPHHSHVLTRHALLAALITNLARLRVGVAKVVSRNTSKTEGRLRGGRLTLDMSACVLRARARVGLERFILGTCWLIWPFRTTAAHHFPRCNQCRSISSHHGSWTRKGRRIRGGSSPRSGKCPDLFSLSLAWSPARCHPRPWVWAYTHRRLVRVDGASVRIPGRR